MNGTARTIIDLHTHLWVPAEIQAFGSADEFVLDNLLAHRELNGIDLSCVSNTLHYSQLAGHDLEATLDDVRAWHEFARGIHRDHPGIRFWASCVPSGGARYVEELERVLDDPAFVGTMVNSSFGELSPDDAAAEQFWEFAAARALPVYLHPPYHICGDERLREYRLVSTLARPADVARALARIIVSGVLERHPGVRLVASHLGGSICDFVNRLDYAFDLREQLPGLGDYGAAGIVRSPSSYLRQVWLETSAYPSTAITGAVRALGAERIVFGSDTPPMMALGRRSVDVVEDADLTATERDLIFGGAALNLLGLVTASGASPTGTAGGRRIDS